MEIIQFFLETINYRRTKEKRKNKVNFEMRDPILSYPIGIVSKAERERAKGRDEKIVPELICWIDLFGKWNPYTCCPSYFTTNLRFDYRCCCRSNFSYLFHPRFVSFRWVFRVLYVYSFCSVIPIASAFAPIPIFNFFSFFLLVFGSILNWKCYNNNKRI